MMIEWSRELISFQVAISVSILMVLALRRPIRAFLGAKVAYGLWWLIPVSAAAAFALPEITVPTEVLAPIRSAISLPPGSAVFAVTDGSHTGPLLRPQALALLCGAGWFIGFLAFWSRDLLRARSLRRSLGPLKSGRDQILVSENTELGPLSLGVFDPVVILPADFESRYDEDERRLIILHERTHIAHQHLLVNALLAHARNALWFNPMVHLALRLVRRDQELACDHHVLVLVPEGRRHYGTALLKTQAEFETDPFLCAWHHQSLIEERIRCIAPPRVPRAARWAALAALLALSTTSVMLAGVSWQSVLVAAEGTSSFVLKINGQDLGQFRRDLLEISLDRGLRAQDEALVLTWERGVLKINGAKVQEPEPFLELLERHEVRYKPALFLKITNSSFQLRPSLAPNDLEEAVTLPPAIED